MRIFNGGKKGITIPRAVYIIYLTDLLEKFLRLLSLGLL